MVPHSWFPLTIQLWIVYSCSTYLLKKKKTNKWTYAVQTLVVQGSTALLPTSSQVTVTKKATQLGQVYISPRDRSLKRHYFKQVAK